MKNDFYNKKWKQCCFFFLLCLPFLPLRAQVTGFHIQDTTVGGGGNNIQVDMMVSDFTNIASFQYGIEWDTTVMTYESVGNFNLDGLTNDAFNLDDGLLFTAWVDPDISGENLPDNTVIFSIFFSADCDTTSGVVTVDFSTNFLIEAATPDDPFTPIVTPGEVTFGPGIDPNIGAVTDVSCHGANDGCISLSAEGGNPPFSYEWSNGGTTAQICGLAPGLYHATVTDSGGCTAVSNDFGVTEPEVLELCQNTVTSPTCLGGDDGCIDLTACGGTPPYSYTWSNGQTGHQICGLTAGTYTATITDNNGCTVASNTITVNEPADPVSIDNASTTDANCTSGGSIDLTVGGSNTPFTFAWSNGETTEDLSDLPASTYTCTISDAEGCTIVSADYVIDLIGNDMEVTNSDVEPVSCHDGNDGAIDLTLTGSGTPFQFAWSSGDTTEDIDDLTSGTYTCTITDVNGCSIVTTDFVVEQPDSPLEIDNSTSQNVTCNGDNDGSISIDVVGGQPPYTYSWNNGGNTADLTGLPPGPYICDITDDNGCPLTTSLFQITEPEPVAVCQNTPTNPTCLNGNDGCIELMACGGVPPFSYTWSNGQTGSQICGLTAGTYTCSISDDNGCSMSPVTIQLSDPTDPLTLEDATPEDATCTTGGSINLTMSGGNAPYSYSWSNGAITEDIDDLSVGTYGCTITDDEGCTVVTPVYTIEELDNDMSVMNTTVDPVDCFGESSGSINITVDGSQTPFTYNWSNGATTEDISGLAEGTYTCTVTDNSGCQLLVPNIEVDQPDAPVTVNSLNQVNVLCIGENTGSISLDVGGGTSPYTYLWSNGATTSGIGNLVAGDYSCTITDNNQCTLTTGLISISEPSDPVGIVNLDVLDVSCVGEDDGSVSFGTSGGTAPYTYAWSTGQTTEDIDNLPSGTYQCTITDHNECTFVTEWFEVDDASAIAVSDATVEDASCSTGGNITLTVNGGSGSYSFLWSNGDSGNPLADVPAGNYSCTITDDTGCSGISQEYNIILTDSDLSVDNTIVTSVDCFNGNDGAINLTVSGNATPYQFNWSNGATTEDIDNLAGGLYSVTITDDNGCMIVAEDIEVAQPSAAMALNSVDQSDVLCFGDATGAITIEITGGTAPYSYLWNNGNTEAAINDLEGGDYQCTVTDDHGCSFVTNAINISQPAAAVDFSNLIVEALSCPDSDDGQIALEGTGGVGPYDYLWNNGATTSSISDLAPGPYQCTITDANGCIAITNTIDVTAPAGIGLMDFTISNANCSSMGMIELSLIGGATPYGYIWSNGSQSAILNANAGTYQCTVTDASGCTFVTQSFVIDLEGSDLSLDAFNANDVECFGEANGFINLAVSGTATPFTFNWSNGATTQNIDDLQPNDYVCTITDANGCSVLSSVITIEQPASLLLDGVESEDVSCANANDGIIVLEVSGGTMPYNYNWNFGGNSGTIDNLSPGTYLCTITDDNGCTVTTAAIPITSPPAIELTSTSIVDSECGTTGNGSIDISVAGGMAPYSYFWNTGAITQDLNNISGGVYTCVITDDMGCTMVTPELIVNNSGSDLIISDYDLTAVSCFGGNDGAIDLDVEGSATPFDFAWSNGATTQNINGLPAGTYTCTITDANDCTSISSNIIVEQPDAGLSANTVVSDVSCNFANDGIILLEIAGGTMPYSYLWSNGATTAGIDDLAPGTYSCEVTDDLGCAISVPPVAISEPAPLELTNVQTEGVICGQGDIGSINITIAGGTTPYIYNWSNGATTEDIDNLSAGNYTCTVTDNNGCQLFTNPIEVDDEGSDLEVTMESPTPVSCFGENDGSIQLIVQGSSPPYSFEWSNGATTPTLTDLPAGAYLCTITDDNGCSVVSSSIEVGQPEAPIAVMDAVIGNSSCTGQANGSIALIMEGGTMPYSYLWSNGATTAEIEGLPVGMYTCTITDNNGCTHVVGPLVIEMPEPLELTVFNTANSNCTDGGFVEIIMEGGTDPYTYLWNNGSNAQSLTGVPAGTYTCTVTDSEGCTFVTQPITIFSDGTDLGWVATNRNVIACFGDNDGSIDIEVSGSSQPFQYLWSNGATSQDIDGLMPGLYSCTVTDAVGCSLVLQDIAITQPTFPLFDQGADVEHPSCADEGDGTIIYQVSGGTAPYNYNWNNGDMTSSPEGLTAGEYICTVTDDNGCELVSDPVVLEAPPAIELTSQQIVHEVEGDGSGSVDIELTGGTEPFTFLWSNGEVTQNIADLSMGDYTCTITDANGCTFVAGPFAVDNLVSTVDLEEVDFGVYPNPVAGILNIRSELLIVTVRLMDVRGIYYEVNALGGEFNQIDLGQLAAGIFVLEVQFQNGMVIYERLVKM